MPPIHKSILEAVKTFETFWVEDFGALYRDALHEYPPFLARQGNHAYTDNDKDIFRRNILIHTRAAMREALTATRAIMPMENFDSHEWGLELRRQFNDRVTTYELGWGHKMSAPDVSAFPAVEFYIQDFIDTVTLLIESPPTEQQWDRSTADRRTAFFNDVSKQTAYMPAYLFNAFSDASKNLLSIGGFYRVIKHLGGLSLATAFMFRDVIARAGRLDDVALFDKLEENLDGDDVAITLGRVSKEHFAVPSDVIATWPSGTRDIILDSVPRSTSIFDGGMREKEVVNAIKFFFYAATHSTAHTDAFIRLVGHYGWLPAEPTDSVDRDTWLARWQHILTHVATHSTGTFALTAHAVTQADDFLYVLRRILGEGFMPNLLTGGLGQTDTENLYRFIRDDPGAPADLRVWCANYFTALESRNMDVKEIPFIESFLVEFPRDIVERVINNQRFDELVRAEAANTGVPVDGVRKSAYREIKHRLRKELRPYLYATARHTADPDRFPPPVDVATYVDQLKPVHSDKVLDDLIAGYVKTDHLTAAVAKVSAIVKAMQAKGDSIFVPTALPAKAPEASPPPAEASIPENGKNEAKEAQAAISVGNLIINGKPLEVFQLDGKQGVFTTVNGVETFTELSKIDVGPPVVGHGDIVLVDNPISASIKLDIRVANIIAWLAEQQSTVKRPGLHNFFPLYTFVTYSPDDESDAEAYETRVITEIETKEPGFFDKVRLVANGPFLSHAEFHRLDKLLSDEAHDVLQAWENDLVSEPEQFRAALLRLRTPTSPAGVISVSELVDTMPAVVTLMATHPKNFATYIVRLFDEGHLGDLSVSLANCIGDLLCCGVGTDEAIEALAQLDRHGHTVLVTEAFIKAFMAGIKPTTYDPDVIPGNIIATWPVPVQTALYQHAGINRIVTDKGLRRDHAAAIANTITAPKDLVDTLHTALASMPKQTGTPAVRITADLQLPTDLTAKPHSDVVERFVINLANRLTSGAHVAPAMQKFLALVRIYHRRSGFRSSATAVSNGISHAVTTALLATASVLELNPDYSPRDTEESRKAILKNAIPFTRERIRQHLTHFAVPINGQRYVPGPDVVAALLPDDVAPYFEQIQQYLFNKPITHVPGLYTGLDNFISPDPGGPIEIIRPTVGLVIPTWDTTGTLTAYACRIGADMAVAFLHKRSVRNALAETTKTATLLNWADWFGHVFARWTQSQIERFRGTSAAHEPLFGSLLAAIDIAAPTMYDFDFTVVINELRDLIHPDDDEGEFSAHIDAATAWLDGRVSPLHEDGQDEHYIYENWASFARYANLGPNPSTRNEAVATVTTLTVHAETEAEQALWSVGARQLTRFIADTANAVSHRYPAIAEALRTDEGRAVLKLLLGVLIPSVSARVEKSAAVNMAVDRLTKELRVAGMADIGLALTSLLIDPALAFIRSFLADNEGTLTLPPTPTPKTLPSPSVTQQGFTSAKDREHV